MAIEIPKTFSKFQLPPQNRARQVSAVEIILLLAIAGLFYWFVTAPKRTELSGLEDKLATLKSEQEIIETQKKQLERNISKMVARPEDIAKLNEALPFDGKAIALYLLVNKLAGEAGVIVENTSFPVSGESFVAGNAELLKDPFGQKRNLKKILGNLSIKGQISQLENFMKKLEESGRFFDLSDFQITVDPVGGMVMTLSLNTYYFAP